MLKRKSSNFLSKAEQKNLLAIARNTIEANLHGKQSASITNKTLELVDERGAFVTLTKGSNLRGCIGFVKGFKPLCETIQEVAEAAAFRDPRFQPLKKNELEQITIEISVLSPMRKISSIKKLKVKRHGLLIKLGKAQGLLLPQVAVQNNWNRETFLKHVCIKAGLEKDDWKKTEAELMIFDAQVFSEKSKH